MKDSKNKALRKRPYEEPKVTATYKKDDIQGTINPHGQFISVDRYINDLGILPKLS